MRSTEGAIDFEAYLKTDHFDAGVKKVMAGTSNLTGLVNKEADQMNRTFQSMGRLAAGAFAGLQLSSTVQEIVRVRGEFQQLEISFNTMLGSKAKADKLMADVTKFAAQTPHGLSETANATKTLIAYGAEADTVIDRLRKLGGIAAGVGAPLGELTKVYGQVMVNGRMETERLNQFLDRGVPMISELAKVLGVAENRVKKMVEEGKVGFPELEKAIDNLTKKGAMFGGLMEEQSKSLVGLQAQLGDAVDAMLNDLGKSSEGIATTLYQGAITAVENYEKVLDVLKVVISAYGAYRAALMLTAAYQNRANIAALINGYIELAKGLRNAVAAQALLNRVTLANPYVLAATALGALIAGFVVYNKEADEATRLTERISDSINAETSKVQALTSQVKDQNLSQGHRADKMKELIALSPDHLKGLNLENVATAEGSKLIDDYVESLSRKIKLQEYEKELTESIQRQNDAKSGKNKLSYGSRILTAMETSGNPYDPAGGQSYMNRLKEKEIELNETIDKQETERQDRIKEMIQEITTGQRPTKKPLTPTTPTGDTKKAAEKEKEIRIKTFQDELDEKKGMYELYERWIQHVGKDAAEEQFQELRKGGENYIDWLNREITRLEQLRDFQYAGFSSQDKSDLDRLLTERGQMQGQKTGIEAFREDLTKAKEEAESLVDYLQYLEAVQRGLDGDKSILASEARLATATEKLGTEKELRSQLDNFLNEVVGSEEKRLTIQRRYATLREGLEERYADNKTEAYQKAMAKIDKAEADEYDKDRQELFEASKEYRALVQGIEDSKTGSLTKQIVAQKKLVDAALLAGGESYDEYIKAYQELLRLQKLLTAEQKISAEIVMNFAGRLGQALSQFEGELGDIGRTLSDVASISLDVNKMMDENATATEKWGSAAEIAGTIITNIARITRERKEAEAEYYRSIIAYQNQYNLALIEQTRIGAESVTTIWGTSFADKIKGAQEAITMANDQLGGVLTKLEEVGQVKVGTETKSAWENIVAGAVGGATYGAIAGGGVFSWAGAIIGGVGGAIVGWLTGRKSEDIYGDLDKTVPGLIKENAAGIKELDVALARSIMDAGLLNDETRLLLENAVNLQEEINAAKEQIEGVVSELVGQMGQNLKSALVGAFIEGQSAALAWGQTVDKVLENIIEQMAYASTIKPFLDKYTQQLTDAVAMEDYNSITGIMGEIVKTGTEVGEMFMGIMKGVQEAAKAQGMDLWSKQNETVRAITGNRISASEETMSLVAGQFNAVRIHTADMTNNMRISVGHLSGILNNTAIANRHLARLERMESLLDDIKKGQYTRM